MTIEKRAKLLPFLDRMQRYGVAMQSVRDDSHVRRMWSQIDPGAHTFRSNLSGHRSFGLYMRTVKHIPREKKALYSNFVSSIFRDSIALNVRNFDAGLQGALGFPRDFRISAYQLTDTPLFLMEKISRETRNKLLSPVENAQKDMFRERAARMPSDGHILEIMALSERYETIRGQIHK